jgi:hypothetical protein
LNFIKVNQEDFNLRDTMLSTYPAYYKIYFNFARQLQDPTGGKSQKAMEYYPQND